MLIHFQENRYFTANIQLNQLGRSNLGGDLDSHLVPAFVGTILAVVVVAVMVIGIAAVVIHKRRNKSKENIEKVSLISVNF